MSPQIYNFFYKLVQQFEEKFKIFTDVIGFNLNFLSLYNKYLNFWFSKIVLKFMILTEILWHWLDWKQIVSKMDAMENTWHFNSQKSDTKETFPCSKVLPTHLCLGNRVKFCLKETQIQRSQFWFCLFIYT